MFRPRRPGIRMPELSASQNSRRVPHRGETTIDMPHRGATIHRVDISDKAPTRPRAEPQARAAGDRVARGRAERDWAATTDGPPNLQVLAKIHQILDTFSPHHPVLTLTELRIATGLPSSTCFRLVHNLVNHGLLERLDDRYRVGPVAIRWAAAAIEAREIIHDATPMLMELRDATGESAHLVVRDGALRLCVALANSQRSIVRLLRIGEAMPLHVGSMGKVFLAFDPEALLVLKGQPLATYTSGTTTDWEQLEKEVKDIRERGYAVSRGERDPDAVGITAPIYDHGEHMTAGVGISGPMHRMTNQQVKEYASMVVDAARRISTALGYQL